jgi:hypothetical protein
MANHYGSIQLEPAILILPLRHFPYPKQTGLVNVRKATLHNGFAGEFRQGIARYTAPRGHDRFSRK